MKDYKACNLELKDLDESKGIVAFYFSPFSIPDDVKDEVTETAFDKTFKENKSRIKHYRNHENKEVPGKILELGKDKNGAYAISQLALKTAIGSDTFEQYKAGIITEHSHGFEPILAEKKSGGGRILKELRLWEVSSLTSWGANQYTPTISVKSIEEIAEYMQKLNQLLTNSKVTDEKAKEILIEYKKLNEIMISLESQIAPVATTHETKEPSKLNLKYITENLNRKN